MEQGLGFVDQSCLAFGAGQVATLGEFLEEEVGQRHGLGDQTVEFRLAEFPDEAVRVVFGGQEDEADLLVVGQRFQGVFQGAPGGLAAGVVAIEGEDDAVDLAQQFLHMGRRGRGAQRCDGVADTVLRQGDDVHVAFGDDGGVGFTQGLARLRQAEQLAALLEERGFRRVQVFGFALVDNAATEGDDLALRIDDGDHQAVAEAVVAAAGLVLDDQAGDLQFVGVVIGEDGLQVLPAVRRIADAEASGHFAGKAAFLAVFDGAWRSLELGLVVGSGARHDLDQRAGLAWLFVVETASFALRHAHPGAAGQFLDGVDEAHALVFHDEADGRTVRAAAEAVVELLGRADREGRRFLVVEGAAGGIVGARLLERHVAIHQVDDVHPGQQILNEGIRNHVLGIRRSGSGGGRPILGS